MLEITIPKREWFNEITEEFSYTKETTLQLEHSLISLSKWEAKWNKPFLNNKNLTQDEIRDYIRCMTLTQNVDPLVYYSISKENFKDVQDYIEAPMTATTFAEDKGGMSREIVTSELIYYWMTASQIPFECQKWHLNRLMTLIRICSIKNAPPKKMSKSQILSKNAALNAARKAQLGTTG